MKKFGAFLKHNWFRMFIVIWIYWATCLLIEIKDEADSCASWSQVSNIESDVSSIESDVSSIESDVTSIKSDVSSIESDVTSIKSDVSSIESDVSTIKNEVTSKYGYGTLRYTIESIEGKLR